MSFTFEQARLAAVAEQLLGLAKTAGATDAKVQLSTGQGLSINMRQGRLRARREEAHNSVNLTVYRDQCQGSTQSTDFSNTSLAEMVKAACAIATHTAADPCAGLADAELMCRAPQNLQIYHPWDVTTEQAQIIAQRIEAGLSDLGGNVESDSATVGAFQMHSFLANSHGFARGYAQSRHSLGATALAGSGNSRHLGYWSSQARSSELLESPEQVGAKAGKKALGYLNDRPLQTGRYRVLFDPHMAIGLLGDIVAGTSGRALFTQSSYLRDRVGTQIMADHLSLREDPFVLGGMASAPFDDDGICGQQRAVVENGTLQSYFLSTYAGRRLGMASTGNASGPYNLSLSSEHTRADDDFNAMLARLGDGLLVTQLNGEGTQLLNGNYSRTAKGFWVESGVIVHPVSGITIAGNLNDMLCDVIAVGSDIHTQGSFSSGSMLISKMQIGGR